ncbi:hypothetical protein SAMN02745129_2179 [Ferrimonas marina]|uniref:Uncharacterized protein n=1 Tax=Ferrimonas marina TaxID=299255 RepID=A0A1M5TK85_9GAMM|nr:hypothetical protein SAMN02745129_2179 [Ferrimonas marina]
MKDVSGFESQVLDLLGDVAGADPMDVLETIACLRSIEARLVDRLQQVELEAQRTVEVEAGSDGVSSGPAVFVALDADGKSLGAELAYTLPWASYRLRSEAAYRGESVASIVADSDAPQPGGGDCPDDAAGALGSLAALASLQ